MPHHGMRLAALLHFVSTNVITVTGHDLLYCVHLHRAILCRFKFTSFTDHGYHVCTSTQIEP
jgi:hypothetical protein